MQTLFKVWNNPLRIISLYIVFNLTTSCMQYILYKLLGVRVSLNNGYHSRIWNLPFSSTEIIHLQLLRSAEFLQLTDYIVASVQIARTSSLVQQITTEGEGGGSPFATYPYLTITARNWEKSLYIKVTHPRYIRTACSQNINYINACNTSNHILINAQKMIWQIFFLLRYYVYMYIFFSIE